MFMMHFSSGLPLYLLWCWMNCSSWLLNPINLLIIHVTSNTLFSLERNKEWHQLSDYLTAWQNNSVLSALGIPIKWMYFKQLDKCIFIHKNLLLFSGPFLIQLLIFQASQKCFLCVIPLQLYFLITISFFSPSYLMKVHIILNVLLIGL